MTFFTELTNQIVLSAEGKDAERYLNNRLSNDLKSLAPMAGMRFAAALSVQGKTEAFFSVIRRSAESFLLFCDGGQPSEVTAAFSRYKVADRLNIENLSMQSKSYHIWPANCSDPVEKIIAAAKNDFGSNFTAFERNRFGARGADLFFFSISDQIADLFVQSGLTGLNSEEVNFLRLKSRIPSFPSELNSDYLLQESGLNGSISTSKGCYVGQEVTQKISSFAQLPFQLSAFTADQPMAAGTMVFADQNLSFKIGGIISSAWNKETSECFGFARIKTLYLQDLTSSVVYADSNSLELSAICDFSAEPCLCL